MRFRNSVRHVAPLVRLRVCVAGTSTVSMFNEKLQAASLFLGEIIAMLGMDVRSKYFPRIPARSKILREVWGAFW